jgi:hypothetical protein
MKNSVEQAAALSHVTTVVLSSGFMPLLRQQNMNAIAENLQGQCAVCSYRKIHSTSNQNKFHMLLSLWKEQQRIYE